MPGQEGSKNQGIKQQKPGKGERWNGRGGAEQSRSELTQTDARFETLTTGEKPNSYNSEDGSGGIVVVVGTWEEVGTSPPKPIPGSKDS